jgi:hypothetical protein
MIRPDPKFNHREELAEPQRWVGGNHGLLAEMIHRSSRSHSIDFDFPVG